MNEQQAEANDTPQAHDSGDLLSITQIQFRRAKAHIVGLKRGLIEFFELPKRIIKVYFPIEMEDGSVRTFQGIRVLHNQVLGPGKAVSVITRR